MSQTEKILRKEQFDRDDLVKLLNTDQQERLLLFKKSEEVKQSFVGNKVYFRGLIEFSNRCTKNCMYCGVRAGNTKVIRYDLTDDEVLEAARFAHQQRFASIVIQSGEKSTASFTARIETLLKKIHEATRHELHVTLSLGEQSESTYRRWREAGAQRYLLRIEVSNPELYKKLHPDNGKHDYNRRLEALHTLKSLGYQLGTGVMIGLPFQSPGDLADDLLFMQALDIDMAGMGPYIEHHDTPLYRYRDLLLPRKDRFYLSLKMVALLRIMMKNINIAATTAMQSIDPQGREKAIKVGANVIMPNLTPLKYRENYLLYQDKPCIDEEAEQCRGCLEARIHMAGAEIAWGEWGDSDHYQKRQAGVPETD
ncbi:MAG TPA: [FeFe] hydrogenase H-cluster radical SAM maturase HydE [Bacteroidales bacterium]|nr:[FeFe] hydrogenase H-cluster radical SAM maturase HydE [Bacteroidales bacterium]HSA43318.1 [FeFe] hydrogenase H-cluster radical SAM maturase HydE [Bacteroidales bacterium]